MIQNIIKKLNRYKRLNLFITYCKQKAKKLLKIWQKFRVKYPLIVQFLQLSALYFYASITLIYSIINTLGTCPEFIFKTLPFIKNILAVPLFRILASPEKTYMLYFLAIEYILTVWLIRKKNYFLYYYKRKSFSFSFSRISYFPFYLFLTVSRMQLNLLFDQMEWGKILILP